MCWGKKTELKKKNNVNWLHTNQTDLKNILLLYTLFTAEKFTVASKLERSMQQARSHVQVLKMFLQTDLGSSRLKPFHTKQDFCPRDLHRNNILKNKWFDGFLLRTSLSADFCLQTNMFNQWSVLFRMMSSSEWETTTSTTRSRTISVWRSASSWDTKTKVMLLIFMWWCHEGL